MWILFNDVFRNVRMGQTAFLNTVKWNPKKNKAKYYKSSNQVYQKYEYFITDTDTAQCSVIYVKEKFSVISKYLKETFNNWVCG